MDIKVLLNWIRNPVSGETAASRLQPVWGAVHDGHLRDDAFKLIIYHVVLLRTKDTDGFI